MGKRIFDILLAFILLIVFSWVLLIVAVLVLLFLGRPILFKQQRPGLHGKLFTIYKFRTMKSKNCENQLSTDSERLTKFGEFLRKSSLDELPELFNVLKGDMSLVGPRPLLIEYLPLYSKEQARRHEVRPGITGLAQIRGRNNISWGEKFRLDIWYVDHHSILIDLKILCLTLYKVLRKDGINLEGHATTEKFNGCN